ncbi:hypothetical protein PAAG_12445 [Paracoccidioides lutzii Pb01]|uniref:HhH-GPD domain-containing protein n=1 Tax=Paracoccidioides lutzii (strain ATCC MYA-826 / Pb01) TaxID=502779 RepID=A0A0A2UZ93_PARBA|nr:hypothetical protein PAAG_12445 [Paracoccidioides lutzii Pb01]KGQ00901.1 hypothetical protein PAAG_12445 [Paracoccidioides lutzii Pb01]
MAPRRSARVSAITQQAALEKNNVLKQQPPKKEKKTSQNNGVTKKNSAKATPTQTSGKGRKVSTSKSHSRSYSPIDNRQCSLQNPRHPTPLNPQTPLSISIRVRCFPPRGLAEEIDPFNALVSGIIGQQVSGAAAKSIKRKFLGLFGCLDCNGNAEASNNGVNATEKGVGEAKESAEMRYDRDDRFPTPAQVAACGVATLRTAGLSQRKAEYIQGLAEKFASGELSAHMLLQASDEEVLEKLIAVRGLGRWSVEMFECFGLKRMDVFSTGDLGVQRGMATFVGRDVSKLKAKGSGKFKYMSEKEMLEIAAPFSPYRSLLMWYMWRIENVDISIMQ